MSSHPISNSSENKLTLQKSASKTKVLKSTKFTKSARLAGPVTGNGPPRSINAKSKFTEKKMIASTDTHSLCPELHVTLASASKQQRQSPLSTNIEDKFASYSVAPNREQWLRKTVRGKTCSVKVSEKIEPILCAEMGIQTNELEILNHHLLIGDAKFMLPSKSLVWEIERERQEAKKKVMLKTQRKFEEHAEREEEHLTDLKEFLEDAVVTRRARRIKDPLEIDKKLIYSMDEILSKEVRRTSSITDIKGRIEKKEKELLSLFDSVENIQFHSNKN